MVVLKDIELNIPKHIGFIMDGNGRWAKSRGLPRSLGHRRGASALKKVIKGCIKYGIEVVSVYAFSSENWKRPEKERNTIFNMIREFVEDDVVNSFSVPVCVRLMGDVTALPVDVAESLLKTAEDTKDNRGITVNIGINYGARDEIVRAINRAIADGVGEFSEETIESYLDTAGLPPLDLVVRSSGEVRLSNFMMWQASYSEFIFLDKNWPEMTAKDVKEILEIYSKRSRRFGGLTKC